MLILFYPISISVLGLYLKIKPPKMNSIIALRTRLSTLSQVTFNYANNRISGLFILSGIVTSILITLCRIFINNNNDSISYLIKTLVVFCPLIPIYIVNSELRNNFDDTGSRFNY